MLLHTLVDYDLHIPANIVYFSFLVAIFFADPSEREPPGHRRRQGRHTPRLTEQQNETRAPSIAEPEEPPPNQIKNPLLD